MRPQSPLSVATRIWRWVTNFNFSSSLTLNCTVPYVSEMSTYPENAVSTGTVRLHRSQSPSLEKALNSSAIVRVRVVEEKQPLPMQARSPNSQPDRARVLSRSGSTSLQSDVATFPSIRSDSLTSLHRLHSNQVRSDAQSAESTSVSSLRSEIQSLYRQLQAQRQELDDRTVTITQVTCTCLLLPVLASLHKRITAVLLEILAMLLDLCEPGCIAWG